MTFDPAFFTETLGQADPAVRAAIDGELDRQRDQIELIASENTVSRASLEALGSVMVIKTVEGYPGKRYYGGAEYADALETLAIERAKELFGCAFANVQPHSGSQANQAVYLALMQPGETLMGMALSAGGHLSHGAKPNLTGKWLNAVPYGVRRQDGLIDYDALATLAAEHRPQVIVAGGSAYPRRLDWPALRRIADDAGSYLVADIAHFAGLVAAGVVPSPFPHADVVTTTTYKNLRGVRGGVILSNDAALAKKIDSAVFPGIQGSVMLNTVAAKAVCLGEALKPEFTDYAHQVLANAEALAAALLARDIDLVSGGTEMPMVLVDLRRRGITGAEASDSLEDAGLTCNKNAVPFDEQPPQVTSGLRLGVSAGTARGFGADEFTAIGHLIADVLDGNSDGVRDRVGEMCRRFPIYPEP